MSASVRTVYTMDPEYYEKRAEDARKKSAAENRKAAEFEMKAAKEDGEAAKDTASALKASSEATARSRRSSAESHTKRAIAHRKAAASARETAARADGDAAKAIESANKERGRREKARLAKERQATADRKREEGRAKREADREARLRRTRDGQVDSKLSMVGASTERLTSRMAQVEADIAASKKEAPSKVKVLFIAGTPMGGQAALRLDREAREIESRIKSRPYRDQIEVRFLQATQVRDLTDALNEHAPDIVHFSGHGDDGCILLDDANGTPREFSGDALGSLLSLAPRPIALMVFNACNSASQADAATSWAAFAIGMEQPIDDEAAKEWAGQFYSSLASGMPVNTAFEQANAMAAALTSETATGAPQLFYSEERDPLTTVLVASPA